MSHAVGIAADRDSVMRVGPTFESYVAVANRYYDAYAAYVSGRASEAERDGCPGQGVSGVAANISGILPPVWVGCSGGGNAAVSGAFQIVGDVFGVLPSVSRVECGAESVGATVVGERDATVDPVVGDESTDSGDAGRQNVAALADDSAPAVGKHNARNRVKRANRAARQRAQGVLGGVGGSVSGSVCTVDTRTGVEIEASQTLAARRVAENKLAVEKAEAERLLTQHRIRALKDKDRTKAIEKLAATRMEEKINKAKKNSEASYKDCEKSLKSLGSTGSAGEFALKQQIKDARENELTLAYVKRQADFYAKHASPEVNAAVAAMKPPVFEDEFDVFGDCPEEFSDDERREYFETLNRRNAEKADQCFYDETEW